ncbi:bacteriochlorophyll 4-vinyl reductase [Staphylococcus equorum subsp. linens]|uniref:EcsC family protein n=1 Tax=Staphylococcus equorum TaxID=246432 RepID=UPI000CD00158|nr:EcsC family protein [Staphylococcus equorum]PNZ09078.1 bacteriochlorophyll 4-vinyl reductase [Staphylococcus equorum subsp. linens]QQT19203.1 EcsC family protein [Staphylococcus equorum]
MENETNYDFEQEHSDEESKALQAIETAIKLPFVKVDRDEFLVKAFSKNKKDIRKLIEEGPTALYSKKELDKVADRTINSAVLKSTSISFASGLPGGVAMGATIPADMAQFYGFALKLAQEISYIYGHNDLFDDNNELTEESKNELIIFLGVMLGVTAAGSTIRILSKHASKQALTSIPKKTLTKTIYYPILKKVLKTFGVKLTKDTFAKGFSKAIPIVGGAVSGGLNYASLKPMAKKLKNEFSLTINYTEKDLRKDLEIIEGQGFKISEEVDNSL